MKKVSFCGITGNGMSALAQILKLEGCEVRGSDLNIDMGLDGNHRREKLEAAGIRFFPQDGSSVSDDLDTLYITSVINEQNPDVKAALAKGIKIQSRSDLLAEIFHRSKYGIAVGGTCGKTTTTAMIGYILNELGKKPCVINGGFFKNYASDKGLANYIYNRGEICVIEADESDGSIRKYHPYIALINNIGHDHKPLEELKEYFSEFAAHTSHGVVVNYDCPNARTISNHPNTFSYSVSDSRANLFASEIGLTEHGVKYTIDGQSFRLQLLGRFNVSNALAAVSACMLLGIDKFEAARTLEGFTGTERRLECIGRSKHSGITVYDDFAHNPQKIEASLSTLREYPGRIIAVYQAHTPFSARNTGKEDGEVFGRTLNKDDILLMPDIYERIPERDTDISGADLVQYAKDNGVNALYLETKDKVREYILQNARPGDRIIVMGAHDNSLPDFCRSLLKDL